MNLRFDTTKNHYRCEKVTITTKDVTYEDRQWKQITINVNGKEIEKHNFFSDESKTPLPIMKIMKEVEE